MKSTGDRDATTLKIREIGGEALPSIRGAMCYPQLPSTKFCQMVTNITCMVALYFITAVVLRHPNCFYPVFVLCPMSRMRDDA